MNDQLCFHEQILCYFSSKIFKLYMEMQSKKKEIQSYIATNINSFIEPMVLEIVKKRPADPVQYSIKWLQNYQSQKKSHKDPDSDLSDEDDQMPFDVEAFMKNKAQARKRSRLGISEEVFGDFNRKEKVQYRKIQKTENAKILIMGLLSSSILFSNLNPTEMATVVDAMAERFVTKDQTLIEEGDRGDSLFIVAQGQFDCYKHINGEQKYLKCYTKGEAFGELSLMYNSPRAASIIAKTDGKVFELDRITFSHIVKQAAMNKRELYQKVIASVDLFSELNEYEKQKFYDVLKEVKYDAGDYIIKQNDEGKQFYIVLEGNLIAEKVEPNEELPKIVYQYKEGQYFGELSLVHDVKRQASVKAVTNVRLACIQRQSFKRLLGGLEDILKRNQQRYTNLILQSNVQ